MKKIFIIAYALFSFHAQAAGREGDKAGNGGGPNEIKFKEVARNIREWIESGNADSILLPAPISLGAYKSEMIAALKDYQIEFTEKRIVVNGGEKICKNYRKSSARYILCHGPAFGRIYETNLDDIYRIVHHEFAGLAGYEVNRGQDSDYTISQQISTFLKFEWIKRLPVRKPEPEERGNRPALGWRSQKSGAEEPTVIRPFILNSPEEVSEEDTTGQGGFRSTAGLLAEGIFLGAEDSARSRRIEARADSTVSIFRRKGEVTFEASLRRVPEIGTRALASYECILVETGERIHVDRGSGILSFPSQKKLNLVDGKIEVNTTVDALYFSQYVVTRSADGLASADKAVVKIVRGNFWAEMKFPRVAHLPAAMITCQISDR